MGKKLKQAKQPSSNDIRQFPITKNKSFLLNLNGFIKNLQEHHSQLTSREFVKEVHTFIARYKQKNKAKQAGVQLTRHKIRICRECDGWSGNSTMLQCTLCEDYYHQQCLGDQKRAFEESGLCSVCDRQKIEVFNKQHYLTELMKDSCFQCQKERQGRQAFVHCLKCSNRFHKYCYGKNVVVCNGCKAQIDEQLKKKPHIRQSTLQQWGCSSKKKEDQKEESTPKTIKTCDVQESYEENKFKNNEESHTQPFRQKDLFCYNFQQMEQEQIQAYKKGLVFAILAKNMKYTETLQPVDCSLDIDTEQSLDFGLDHMTKSQYQTYKQYKKQPIGPFRFVFKEGMGYDVVADRDIKEKTLICEYIGQVVTLRRCIDLEATSKNDSLMELRSGYNSQETLIIRPDKQTNMARFINGINNTKGGNKANVATVRKLAKGMPTVVLYTVKNIKKGESLLYDYNAGNTTCKYDTSNFI